MNVPSDEGSILTFREPWTCRGEGDVHAAATSEETWLDYCRSRERKERAAAKQASSVLARRIHQELAQAYASKANGGDGRGSR